MGKGRASPIDDTLAANRQRLDGKHDKFKEMLVANCLPKGSQRFSIDKDYIVFYQAVYNKAEKIMRLQDIVLHVETLWHNYIEAPDQLEKRLRYQLEWDPKFDVDFGIPGFCRFYEQFFNIKLTGNVEISCGGESCILRNVVLSIDEIKRRFRDDPLKKRKLNIADFDMYEGKNIVDDRRLKELVGDNRLRSPKSRIKLKAESKQVGFSAVKTLQEALTMCGKGTTYSERDFKTFMNDDTEKRIENTDAFKRVREHTVNYILMVAKAVPNFNANETTKRVYINPYMFAACMLLEGVTVHLEKQLEGPYGKGPLDYAFMYKGAIVNVTVAKNGDIEQGIRQNVAQLAALRFDRERKYHGTTCTYYGIVTTADIWKLVELHGNKLVTSALFRVSSTKICEKEVGKIIATIVNVLEKCKKDYDVYEGSNKNNDAFKGSDALDFS